VCDGSGLLTRKFGLMVDEVDVETACPIKDTEVTSTCDLSAESSTTDSTTSQTGGLRIDPLLGLLLLMPIVNRTWESPFSLSTGCRQK
jgi:hypothetical protein